MQGIKPLGRYIGSVDGGILAVAITGVGPRSSSSRPAFALSNYTN